MSANAAACEAGQSERGCRLSRAKIGGGALRAVVMANAAAFAVDLEPVVADIRKSGHMSLRAIAAELTARGIRTRRRGKWGVGSVKNLLGVAG